MAKTNTTTNRDKARNAYFQANGEALQYLEEIKTAIEDRALEIPCIDNRPAPDWADAGTAQHIAEQLKHIADGLLKRGEFAE